VTPQQAAAWANALERAAGRQGVEALRAGLDAAAAAAPVNDRCLSLVTLRWDNDLAGGLVFVDQAGALIARYPGFPGASSPKHAGPGRVVFEYTSERGSGVRESRLVALCALADDLWVKCVDVMKSRVDRAAGFPPGDAAAVGVMMQQEAEAVIRGDSILLSRRASYRGYGDSAARTVDLGRTIILLPPVRGR
jgi:hypothetical protein